MIKIIKFLICILITGISNSSYAANIIDKLEMNIQVDKTVKQLEIQLKLTLKNLQSNELKFILNDSFKHLTVSNGEIQLPYTFDENSRPNIYLDGGLLTINKQQLTNGDILHINYKLDISSIN